MKPKHLIALLPGHFYWLLIECAIGAFLLWGGIGFDHPGTFGLDYNGFLIIAGILAFLTLIGTIAAAAEMQWFWVAMHLLFAICFVWLFFGLA